MFFVDFDLDGYLDIFAANGHIEEEIGRVQPRVQYKQPPLVFRNKAAKGFDNITQTLGASFNRPIVARGAAHGDIDRDGDPDLVITTNHGRLTSIATTAGTETTGSRSGSTGTKSNRSAIGAVVRIEIRVRKARQRCPQRFELLLTKRFGAHLRARR